jgi:hypothetical protein
VTSTDTSARFTERELSIHPSEKLLNSSVVPFLLGSSVSGPATEATGDFRTRRRRARKKKTSFSKKDA